MAAEALFGFIAHSLPGIDLLHQSWSARTTPYFIPTQHANQYDAWWGNPILEPGPEQLFAAWQRGHISATTLHNWLRDHGMDVPATFYQNAVDPALKPLQYLWRQVMRSNRKPMPMDILIRNYWLGAISDVDVQAEIRQYGYSSENTRNWFINRREIPGGGEILTAWKRGLITFNDTQKYLAASGFTGADERDILYKLTNTFPTIAELVSYKQGMCLNNDLVNKYNLDVGYTDSFGDWSYKQGYKWNPGIYGLQGLEGQDVGWDKLIWRNHWRFLSPMECMQALMRLKPTIEGGDASYIPGVKPFTGQNFVEIMRTYGYTDQMIEWLYGLAFEPIGIRQIRLLYTTYSFTREQVKAALLRAGHTDADAEALTREVEAIRWQKETGKARNQLASEAEKSYLKGVIDENTLAKILYQAEFRTEQQQQIFDATDAATQLNQATAYPTVKTRIQTIKLEQSRKIAEAAIAAIHKRYLRREIDDENSKTELSAAGVNSPTIQLLLTEWQLELAARGKQASASQVINWLKRGVISNADAAARLSAMGFDAADILAMFAVATQDIALARAKQAERNARTAQQAQRAQAAQLKLLRTERDRIISHLNHEASRAGVIKFYIDGLISRFEAKYALEARDIDADSAELWLRDADIQKEKKQKSSQGNVTQGKTTKTAGTSGNGSSTT